MEKQTIRIRRLGSVTFGIVLVTLGVSFIINRFFPALDYIIIFRFWPVLFILLGIEVLLGSRYKMYEVIGDNGKIIEQCKVIYDIPAIIMTFCVVFLAVSLAWADWLYTNQVNYITFN